MKYFLGLKQRQQILQNITGCHRNDSLVVAWVSPCPPSPSLPPPPPSHFSLRLFSMLFLMSFIPSQSISTCTSTYTFPSSHIRQVVSPISGTDISICLLALASEVLKKGLSGTYILICTCLNSRLEKLIFRTLHIFHVENDTNTQKYANNATRYYKENGFQIIKSMMNNVCHFSIL